MSRTLEAPTMPNSKKPKRDDRAVKLDRVLARKARIIAEDKGIPLAEYLSELVRSQIEKDWPKAKKGLDEGSS